LSPTEIASGGWQNLGKKQALLLTQIRDLQPDVIVFTGDLVVSRGLGNSVFPLRIFNRPEIVLVII
jgi:predicted MPP superfamily phosphohydrolase